MILHSGLCLTCGTAAIGRVLKALCSCREVSSIPIGSPHTCSVGAQHWFLMKSGPTQWHKQQQLMLWHLCSLVAYYPFAEAG